MVRAKTVALWLMTAVPTGAVTYAVVNGVEITQGDVIFAMGRVPTDEKELSEVVTGLVERKILVGLAERRGLTVTEDELDRTLALIAKTLGPNKCAGAEDYRNQVAEELLVCKYIEEYVYPRVKPSDDDLKRLFLLIPGDFVRPIPRTRTELVELFPLYRNEVLARYVKIEVSRLLAEDVKAVEKALDIKYYIKVNIK